MIIIDNVKNYSVFSVPQQKLTCQTLLTISSISLLFLMAAVKPTIAAIADMKPCDEDTAVALITWVTPNGVVPAFFIKPPRQPPMTITHIPTAKMETPKTCMVGTTQ